MKDITGLVLAGGMGRRMDSRDKGLIAFRGKPMVAHVIERLAPQVGSLIINANRNLDQYGGLGYPVVSDEVSGYAGPLAGLHAGLRACTTPLIVTAPCDSPFLPTDLDAPDCQFLRPLIQRYFLQAPRAAAQQDRLVETVNHKVQ